jgi:hypothetical protein
VGAVFGLTLASLIPGTNSTLISNISSSKVFIFSPSVDSFLISLIRIGGMEVHSRRSNISCIQRLATAPRLAN